jgi:hypothetical protein
MLSGYSLLVMKLPGDDDSIVIADIQCLLANDHTTDTSWIGAGEVIRLLLRHETAGVRWTFVLPGQIEP